MNKNKIVYAVIHGDTFDGANPGMTADGFRQIKALKPLLPAHPALVICGTGRRHHDIMTVLNYWGKPLRWTASVGGPESRVTIHEQKTVLLADGITIAQDKYTTTEDGRASMLIVLYTAPNNSVICAGRTCLNMLGRADAKLATVYRISFEGAPTLDNLEIQEVQAACDADDGPG